MNIENRFFERPILNSPYEYPAHHWELDAQGQPTQQIIDKRRRAKFTEVYQIETDFKAKVEAEFNKMIEEL
jgi:hypothetical protein